MNAGEVQARGDGQGAGSDFRCARGGTAWLCAASGAAGSVVPVLQWGLPARELSSPGAVVTDSSGTVYVADTGHNQVEKYDSAGNLSATWKSLGAGGTLSGPKGLAVDSSGNVYVADTGHGRIVKLSPAGSFTAAYGSSRARRGGRTS